MGTDRIFEELGETISKTAKAISEKADDFLEIQKVNGKVNAQRRQIEKALEKLGAVVYQRYVDGEQMDLELSEICDEVTRHKMEKAQYEERLAKLQGKKICPACGKPLHQDAAYCSYCGAPCETETEKTGEGPMTEEDPREEDVEEETVQEADAEHSGESEEEEK